MKYIIGLWCRQTKRHWWWHRPKAVVHGYIRMADGCDVATRVDECLLCRQWRISILDSRDGKTLAYLQWYPEQGER